MKNFKSKHCLITGGSSGIGLALAKNLAARGAHVWILARRPDVLQKALAEIESQRSNPQQQFGSLQCDLSDRPLLEATLQQHVQEIGVPDLLIHAAGYAHPDTFLNIEPDVFYQQMDVNYFGTVNTIRCILPGMLERDSGHIVNICSAAGFITFYGFTAYSASKYALRGFSDALRSELAFTGVQLSISFPPDTDTPGLEQENRIKPAITHEVSRAAGLALPDTVARSILKGVQRERYLILTGFENNLFFRLSNILGGWLYPVMDRIVAAAAKKTAK